MHQNDGDTGLTVGERIELRRRERGLSRRVVANTVGRSEEWLRLVESGRQPLDSLQAIIGLAGILHISDFRTLITPIRYHPPAAGIAARPFLRAVERAVFDHPVGAGAAGGSFASSSLRPLADEVEHCWTIWSTSPHRYSALTASLPPLVLRSRALRGGSDDTATVAAVMDCYHLLRVVLSRIGGHDLAVIVADRAWEMALELDRPLSTARAAWHIAEALLHSGRFTTCIDYALESARRLSHDVPAVPEMAHIWGALHLTAGMGAFLANDGARAHRLLARAHDAEDSCGFSCPVAPCSGSDAVGLARMDMALRQDNFDEVVRHAGQVDLSDRHSVTARTRYHIALGTAYAHLGESVAASLAFSRAAEICAEELTYDQGHCALETPWRGADPQLHKADVAHGPLGG